MDPTKEAGQVQRPGERFLYVRKALLHCPETQAALSTLDRLEAEYRALSEECDHLRALIVARDAADEQSLANELFVADVKPKARGQRWIDIALPFEEC